MTATTPRTDLPVVVVGAGPVGLAAAAHLTERGLPYVVLEAGSTVAAAVRAWGHVRTFTPWSLLTDAAAERLLAPTGWVRPTTPVPPTGAEIVERYLEPLAGVLGDAVRLEQRVVAVSRAGLDRSRTLGRADRPFVVRVRGADGVVREVRARAVIDASGTWGQPNPLGASGLPVPGEDAAGDVLVGPLPDVLGGERHRFAGRTTLVVGSGHSAATTLLALARLAQDEPGTRAVWAIRGTDPVALSGSATADALPARGRLGETLRGLVRSGAVRLVTGFAATGLVRDGATATVVGETEAGTVRLTGLHTVVVAAGFRPDLSPLAELRVDVDPGLECARALGPLVDPAFHSCGTVPPHGHRELAHPEPDLYVVGVKSYGRAPTFLLATGHEQVRSVVAALAGDTADADRVHLVLPETGVCSVTDGSDAVRGDGSDDDSGDESPDDDGGDGARAGCCGPATPTTLALEVPRLTRPDREVTPAR